MVMFPVYGAGLVEAYNPSPPAITPTAFGFFQPLSTPPGLRRANKGPASFLLYNPSPPAATPTQYGFFQPLSRPTPQHRPSSVGPSNFLLYNPNTPALTPTQFGFFQPWIMPPAREKSPIPDDMPFFYVPPALSFGFFQPLSHGAILNARLNKAIWSGPAPVFVPADVTPPPPDTNPYIIRICSPGRLMNRF